MPSDWERVAGDPALLAAVRDRYDGSGDALDQLWWFEHPGEPTPDGVQDPADGLERSRRALYRPGSAPGDAVGLDRREADVEADRSAARRALVAADRTRPSSVPQDAPARRITRRTVAGAVIAAVLIGGAAGFATARFTGAPHPPALEVFERAQRPDDRPPTSAPLPSFAVRSTLRHLATSLTTGAAVYAARARDGRVCLIAVVQALEYRATCTSDAGFAASGLSETFTTTVDPDDDSGVLRDREITPTWSPEGDVRF